MTKSLVGLHEYFSFVDSVANELNSDFLSKVRDINLGQWETSFEALLLKLIDENKPNTQVDFAAAKELAVAAGIIEEGVLDLDVWKKFCSWYGITKK